MADIAKKFIKIEELAQLQSLIDCSDEKVLLVDVHQQWCGMCDAIQPTLTRIFNEFDGADQRINLAGVSLDVITAEQLHVVFGPDSKVSLTGCMPVFAIFRHKACINIITGVDAPALMSAITLNMPEKPESKEQ